MKIDFQNFLVLLKEQFIEETGELSLGTNFRTLPGWDSMTGMTILLMIEENYNLKIDSEQFKKLTTIENLYNYIIENSNL
jgi:acyl carrier protein